jgi:hypothetical protein
MRAVGNVGSPNIVLAQELGKFQPRCLISVQYEDVLHDELRRCCRFGCISLGMERVAPDYGLRFVTRFFSSLSTTKTASRLAGSVSLALALTPWRSPGTSEKFSPAL